MSRLCSLKIGDRAFIEGFEPSDGDEFSGLDSDCVKALLKIGILPGSEILVVCRALAGDPIAIEVRGARIAVGKREASLIRVKEGPL